MDLIKIENNNGTQAVSGRELHRFLEIETRYNDWFARMVEYGFVEGLDFYSFLSKTPKDGGRPATDHIISLDMAKEICMIQRTDRGKEARQYFIECEKRFKSLSLPHDYLSALRALVTTEEAKQEAIRQIEAKDKAIKELEPKAAMAETFIEKQHCIGFRDLAKELHIKETRLRALLITHGIAYRQGNRWKPYSASISKGWMVVKDTLANGLTIPQALFTMVGKAHIREITLD